MNNDIPDKKLDIIRQYIKSFESSEDYKKLDWYTTNMISKRINWLISELLIAWSLLDKKIELWAIVYINPPYPTKFGKFIKENDDTYIIDFPLSGKEYWYKKNCKLFLSKIEAEKEYYDFRNNKNNYALEG